MHRSSSLTELENRTVREQTGERFATTLRNLQPPLQ